MRPCRAAVMAGWSLLAITPACLPGVHPTTDVFKSEVVTTDMADSASVDHTVEIGISGSGGVGVLNLLFLVDDAQWPTGARSPVWTVSCDAEDQCDEVTLPEFDVEDASTYGVAEVDCALLETPVHLTCAVALATDADDPAGQLQWHIHARASTPEPPLEFEFAISED